MKRQITIPYISNGTSHAESDLDFVVMPDSADI